MFVWTGNSLSLHHTLEIQDVTALSAFTRADRNIQHLVACGGRNSSGCLVYQWINGSFQNPQPLSISAKVKQVETMQTGGQTILLVVTEGYFVLKCWEKKLSLYNFMDDRTPN